jgi:hypothetical protein
MSRAAGNILVNVLLTARDWSRARLNAPATPDFLAALEDRERRQGNGLDFRKTFEIVSIAASAGRYVSYREVADFSGLAWKTAQRLMPKHLVNLCEYAHRKGWLRVKKTASIG